MLFIFKQSSRYMLMVSLISLLPFILLLTLDFPDYITILLFTIEFLLVGISVTCLFYPDISFKEITRKPILIVAFSIISTLISMIITIYLLKTRVMNVVTVLSAFAVIFSYIALYRQQKLMVEDKEESLEIIHNIYTVISLSIVAIVGIFVPPFNRVLGWAAFALPFMVFLPGYYVFNGLIPQKDEFSYTERAVAAIFISALMTSVIGIILMEVVGELDIAHLSLIMIMVTIVSMIYYVSKTRTVGKYKLFYHKKTNDVLKVITIVALIVVLLSGIHIQDQESSGNATLDVNGINKTANEDGYVNFTNGEVMNLSIDVANHQFNDKNYVMKIVINNDTTNKVLEEHKVSLKNNESTTITTNITMSPGNKDIQFILYDEDNNPVVIRHLKVSVSDYMDDYSYSDTTTSDTSASSSSDASASDSGN